MMVQKNISLKPYNSFGIDVQAKEFASFTNVEELSFLLKGKEGSNLVLGGGSNVLFTKDFNGIVLKNEMGGIQIVNEDEDYVFVKAGAGENWNAFVQFCIHGKLAGVENLSLIPGSVGASPMQNIGAYGVEIKDVFHSLTAYHKADKALIEFSAADCAFGYRESVFKHKFKNQFVILSVTYRLNKTPRFNTSYGAIEQELERMEIKEPSIAAIAQAVINIRRSKLPDPALVGNAGSFFKNPEISQEQFEVLKVSHPAIVGYYLPNANVKLAAGWLIEQCGWKGYRKGDAGCHDKQALVLVNYGNASGADIFNLSTQIVDSVQATFGLQLEREVNII